MMVLIKKNNKTMTVPNSAYNNFYKQNGWDIVNGIVEEPVVTDEVTPEEELTDDDWADIEEEEEETAGIEKPLSEMNRKELEAKALSLGINISKANSNKEIRELIKNNR